MKRIPIQLYWFIPLGIACITWLSGCAYTTKSLIVDTGRLRDYMHTVESTSISNMLVHATGVCVRVEHGLPRLCLGYDSRSSKKSFTQLRGSSVLEPWPAHQNTPRSSRPFISMQDERSFPTQVNSIPIQDLSNIRYMYFAERATDVLAAIPPDLDLCILQRRSLGADNATELALFLRTPSGCNIYPLRKHGIRTEKSNSRFWKIPLFLPVAIVWDVFNTVATPPAYVYTYCFGDWLPH